MAQASYVAGFPVPLPLPPGLFASVLQAASKLCRRARSILSPQQLSAQKRVHFANHPND